jgi:hypothetical protein
VNGAALLPVRRTRLGAEWRDFVELWFWPLVVALLPYRLGIALARLLSRRLALYEDAAREAVVHWRDVMPGGDERAWLAAYRFAKLVDHADLYWALTRSDAFLLSRFVQSREPVVPPPLVLLSFHYGQGLWLMRWLRQAGVHPRFLSVPSVREGADSTLMFLYGRVRIRVVERLAGAEPIFLGGARRAIEDALRARQTVYALVDVPARNAAAQAGNCTVLGRAVTLPTGVIEAAKAANAGAVVLTARVLADGRRAVDAESIDDAASLSIERLGATLTRRLEIDSAAWHFWNVWHGFAAR